MSLLKEPLFHFFLLGVAIFAWFSYLNPSAWEAAEAPRIVVDEQDIDRLVDQFQSTWQRPPTPEELSALQSSLLRQEVLVREARALGLDRNDTVVRNRLAQKMEFLTLSLAQATEPDDETLQSHLAENNDRFVVPGRVAFQQVNLASNPDQEEIQAMINALNNGSEPAQLVSAPSLLPAAIPLSTAQQVDASFGRGFYTALMEQPQGQWVGPVQSGFGSHLVRIDGSEPAHVPPFEQIRQDVLFDWRRSLTSDLSDAQFETLKAKYELVTPSPEDIARRLEQ